MTEAPADGRLEAASSSTSTSTSPLRGKILLHSAIQLLGRGANAAGAIVVVSILTRYLGKSGYGDYTFVTAYVSLFYVIVDSGTQSIAVREMARRPDEAGLIGGQLLTLKTVLAAISLGLALAIAFLAPSHAFSSPGIRVGVFVLGLGLMAAPFMGSAQAIFQINLRMTVPAVADALTRYVSLALLAILAAGLFLPALSAAQRLDAVLLTVTIGLFAGTALVFRGASRLMPLRFRHRRRLAIQILRDAFPVAAISSLGLVHYRIDIIILTLVSSKGNVALYGVATKLLDVSLAGLAVFMVLVFPVLSRLAAEDPDRLREAFQHTLDFILIIGIGAAMAVTALAPFLIHTITTRAFGGAVQPLTIIAWAIPITFVETLFSQMVIAANRQLTAIPVMVVATVLNIGLNLWLIPHLGASAPALVTDITEGVACLGLLWVMAHAYRFRPSLASMLKILVAAFVAGAVLKFGAGFDLVLALLGGGFIYVALLLSFRVITLHDARTVFGR